MAELWCLVENWWAWAPEVEEPAAWRAWARSGNPVPPSSSASQDSVPDVSFLPAMLRRRLSPLSKSAFYVSYKCLNGGSCRTVFASRHGECDRTVDILRAINRKDAVSPTAFSLSVHNAASGLYTIARKETYASTAIAAGKNTFAAGWLEAASLLDTGEEEQVLLVYYDQPSTEIYSEFDDDPRIPFAVAFLLRRIASPEQTNSDTQSIGLTVLPGEPVEPGPELQFGPELQPMSFLRFFLSDNATWLDQRQGSCWGWRKETSNLNAQRSN